MRLLLDTHIVIALADGHRGLLSGSATHDETFASVVNLWEIAIKHRLGKLNLGIPPLQLPELLENHAIQIIDVNRRHVLEELETVPPTRDPFDRLLLAQCQVEGMKLVTTDDKLIDHPLTWRVA